MKDVLKTLSESNNSHWTSFVGAEQPAANEKSLIFDEGAVIDPQKETENTIAAISQLPDCAVLVISGTDGVQAHTMTLWRLLEQYGVPTFLFINKMDLPGTDRKKLLEQLQQELGAGCVDFTADFEEISWKCKTFGRYGSLFIKRRFRNGRKVQYEKNVCRVSYKNESI